MAGRWRTEARDELAVASVEEVLAQLPAEARDLVASHAPTRARVLARSDYLSHLAVAQGQLAVALNAEVKIGETLGMFRDREADTVALALVKALGEAAVARQQARSLARTGGKVIEATVTELPITPSGANGAAPIPPE